MAKSGATIYKTIVYQFMNVLLVRAVNNLTERYVSHLNMDSWTSCEQFLANTTFDKSKIIDIDWKIFYFWSPEKESTYHLKFRIPSRLLTDRFKVELQDDIKPPVNWTEAELFMETTIDFSALFMRTNTPGKFRLIPSFAFQVKTVPVMIFALKYVDPYLGIMNCKHRLCYALAPIDKMPKTEDLKLEAEKIGFSSEHGYSYQSKTEPPPSLKPFSQDDADDDEQLDIAEHGDAEHYSYMDDIDEDDL